ncbi:MAG: MFS transporter, partial [Acidimicrobiales bacterium]|nr:MFS transporter [Acidimicrobiales bacterium]
MSNLGDGIRLAALPLLAVELTSDPVLIAGVTAVTFLPWVLVGPIAGAIVDRGNRRRLMLAGQVLRGSAALSLAVSVSSGRAGIGTLYAAALAISAGETVVDSAAQAAVPRLVPTRLLERANGQLTIAENLFNDVLGVALGAVVFAHAASLPFYLDAATFAVGATLLLTIRRPLQEPRTAPRRSLVSDVRDGFRYLGAHRFLRTLAAAVALTNIGLYLGWGSMVILVVTELGAPPAAYGSILAIGAVGGVIGSVVATRLSERLTPQRVLAYTHAPFLAGAALSAVATRTWMVSVAFALSSFALVTFQIPGRTMRQVVTPDAVLGRVVSAFRIFGLGGPVIGAPIGGAISGALGVRYAFAASIAVLALAWATVLRSLRSYDPPSPLDDPNPLPHPTVDTRQETTPMPDTAPTNGTSPHDPDGPAPGRPPRERLHEAARLVDAASSLFDAGVMSHSGHGNLSTRLGERSFLLTTTGAIRGLEVDQLGVIDMDGTLVEGELAPDRAEIVAMHTVLYRTRPDVGSVFHTHSPGATAFALANEPLPARTEALLRFGQAHPIPVVPWGPRGSQASVRGIEAVLAEQPRTIAVLLANHGLLAFGPDPATTADLVIAIEETA